MVNKFLSNKIAASVAVVAAILMAATAATASAHGGWWSDNFRLSSSNSNTVVERGQQNGYSADQCKNGGWREFEDENGDPMFRNQGQCIRHFRANNEPPGHQPDFGDNWWAPLAFFFWRWFSSMWMLF